ncbi:Heterokaryon incompatibility protein (HET) domain containing protein, partial [Rhypophila sp. PSN 637]
YYLEVSNNLYQGLTEIRRRMDTKSDDCSAESQELYVWADAICINQRDTDEVNQQVNMMDRIYSQASKVVVWLGADTRGEMPRVDEAFRPLSKMRRIITDERLTPGSAWRESSGIPDTEMADLLSIVGLPPLDSADWSVILGLFNRTWFRRLWVVQEIALASKIEVWCGGATFSWRTIERVTELLKWDLEDKIIAAGDKTRADSFYSLPSRSASILTSIRKWATSSRVPSSLFGTYKLVSGRDKYHSSFVYAVLGALFPYEATDPRDKVFGALGLVRKLSTDLATSPLGEVYTAATKKIISGTGWLGMLSLVKVPKERRHELLVGPLPSWVPTLTWNSVPTLSLRGDHSFNASGRFRADLTGQTPASPPSIQFSRAAAANIAAIGFPARRIAIVRRKSEPLQDFMCQKSTFEAGVDLLLDLAASQGIYPTTGEHVIDAF